MKSSAVEIYISSDFKNSIAIYEELLEAQPKNQEYLENYLAVLAADEKKFEKDLEERKKVVPLQSRSETTGFFAALKEAKFFYAH